MGEVLQFPGNKRRSKQQTKGKVLQFPDIKNKKPVVTPKVKKEKKRNYIAEMMQPIPGEFIPGRFKDVALLRCISTFTFSKDGKDNIQLIDELEVGKVYEVKREDIHEDIGTVSIPTKDGESSFPISCFIEVTALIPIPKEPS